MLRIQRLVMVLVLALAVLAATVGCRSLPDASAAQPEDLAFVIPPGAAAAQMRGEPVVTIPPEIHLVAGQSVTVQNRDSAMHYFFYAPIAPGQSLRKTFAEPGRFGYSGVLSCSIAQVSGLTVEVGEP